jgi:transcriptional regulator with XRE-family HTH domain
MARVHPLSTYRKEHSLTLAELGRMLGVYPSTVFRWERGKRKISEDDIPKISEATGIAPADLRPDLAELMTRGSE